MDSEDTDYLESKVYELENQNTALFDEIEKYKKLCYRLEKEIAEKNILKKKMSSKRERPVVKKKCIDDLVEESKEEIDDLVVETRNITKNLRPKRQKIKYDKNKAYFDAVDAHKKTL